MLNNNSQPQQQRQRENSLIKQLAQLNVRKKSSSYWSGWLFNAMTLLTEQQNIRAQVVIAERERESRLRMVFRVSFNFSGTAPKISPPTHKHTQCAHISTNKCTQKVFLVAFFQWDDISKAKPTLKSLFQPSHSQVRAHKKAPRK